MTRRPVSGPQIASDPAACAEMLFVVVEAIYFHMRDSGLPSSAGRHPPQRRRKLRLVAPPGPTLEERFWLAWAAGGLGLPYASCSVDQAYRAYSHFAAGCDALEPTAKPVFVQRVLTASSRVGPTLTPPRQPLRPLLACLKLGPSDRRRTTRLLLVDSKPAELSAAAHGATCIHAFEKHLMRYLSPRSPQRLRRNGGGER
jgi:hypothetical protein